MSSFAIRAWSSGLPFTMQSRRLGKQGVGAIGENDAMSQEFAVFVTSGDSGDLSILPDEVDNRELGIDLGPGLLCRGCVPLVEFRAQNAVRVVRRLSELHRPEDPTEHGVRG